MGSGSGYGQNFGGQDSSAYNDPGSANPPGYDAGSNPSYQGSGMGGPPTGPWANSGSIGWGSMGGDLASQWGSPGPSQGYQLPQFGQPNQYPIQNAPGKGGTSPMQQGYQLPNFARRTGANQAYHPGATPGFDPTGGLPMQQLQPNINQQSKPKMKPPQQISNPNPQPAPQMPPPQPSASFQLNPEMQAWGDRIDAMAKREYEDYVRAGGNPQSGFQPSKEVQDKLDKYHYMYNHYQNQWKGGN